MQSCTLTAHLAEQQSIWDPFLVVAPVQLATQMLQALFTSYQLVVQRVKYFLCVQWQHMIPGKTQAIKSSSSTCWKALLSFSGRNSLLLTGTPLQSTVHEELWALLHSVIPTMFDSPEQTCLSGVMLCLRSHWPF